MPGFILATTKSAIANGAVQVRIPGAPADVLAQATWQLDGVTTGCQVLLASQGGRLWAVALVGAKGAKPQGGVDGEAPDLPPEMVGGWGGESTLVPSWSGTWRAGSWRTDTQDLVQGDPGGGTCTGAAFWPASAWGTLRGADLTLTRLAGGTSGPAPLTMALLAGPAGEVWPAVLATADGPTLTVGDTAIWDIPDGWLPRLTSGKAGGIGIVGATPAIIDGAHMDLHIGWERTVA
ncbi:hypothetical protein DUY81_08390 [Acidipropionibacterium acidipropionici]|uniref:Uncharacterized protein n=1 Tax=Acidipropionibacterium acidipropionici TaxID=1748 RepID=A0AAC8YDB5_9ACTN|nr:hypothetical protein [Acidipropionibacterium acidipropionici]AMS04671.1 hypothetical protein AXH35_03395 [Acidipropionibacterium acidipropionici]AOZ46160.1 hypothetical protein A8L58_04860 [Acidipropionibacterium acidipropionici]AZP37811.1 hypothetical protein DUY81_08390 [Acidipropionibacterium acidipropionici]